MSNINGKAAQISGLPIGCQCTIYADKWWLPDDCDDICDRDGMHTDVNKLEYLEQKYYVYCIWLVK